MMPGIDLFRFAGLANPEFLLLPVPILLLLLAEFFTRPAGTITVSTGDTLAKIGGQRRNASRFVPPVLRAAGLLLLAVALARPLVPGTRVHAQSVEVRDIALCVDVSGSMTAQDFIEGDPPRRRDRLYVTKLAVQDFINTRKDNTGDRFGKDRVMLIPYAAYAWTQCGLTLDYNVLERELASVTINKADEKTNRTAIGSAIGLAVQHLSKAEAKSKVIILLTDGINNYGELDPITAAQIAKDYGIRIYTIGAGSPHSRLISGQDNPIDEATLTRIAELTGGEYYRATDLDSLQGAYREINELETTEIDVGDMYTYNEGFFPWAVAGSVCVLASIFSRRFWFEAIP